MSSVFDDVDPTYSDTCSDLTLYSNPKGFFSSLAEETVDLASNSEWLKQVFGKARDDASRFQAVYENNEVMDALTEVLSRVQPLFRGKDAKTSQEKRQEAQKALEEDDLTKALGLASLAVMKAPMTGDMDNFDGGVTLAFALWLRSEVLLKMNRPHAALEDLKVALKERLPAKMRPQYYWRMGHCYKGTNEPTRAKVSYELAARLLSNDEDAKTKLQQDIASLDLLPAVKPQIEEKEGIKLTGGERPNVIGLSKLVRITEEVNKGRFAVANSNIKTGDVLLVEQPYAACLLPDRFGTHCLHCFKRLENNIKEAPSSCPKCSAIAFCSNQCRDIAISSYHDYECSFTDLFIGSGMSILSLIALRMITQVGLETSLQIHSKYVSNEIKTVESTALNDIESASKKSKIKNRKERLNRTRKGMKVLEKNGNEEIKSENEKIEDYKECLELKAGQIYSLCTHTEMRKPKDSLKRILMAMFLTRCLNVSGFFGKAEPEIMKKKIQAIQELILKNLQLLQFNAHEIYETLRGQHQFSGSKALYIAVGIYSTGALFNHECYPAVARYFEGKKIVLRATRPLGPGEVVSENYGPHFLVRSKKERQRVLACRYWFKCDCIACEEEWPLLKDMVEGKPRLRCLNRNCKNSFKFENNLKKCSKCGVELALDTLKKNIDVVNNCITGYQKGAKHMEDENPLAAMSSMCPSVDIFHSVATAPHKETHLVQESLRSCFAAFGNEHLVQVNKKQ